MSDITSLRSYLVGLGFSVNTSEFNKFKDVLGLAEKNTDSSVAKIAKDVIKWQGAITGMFFAVSAAIVTTLDKVATADQDYRLFGERMFMDTKHARAMQIAVDALGHSLDEIAFDPELYQRFQLLQKDQANLGAGLGGDFETTMRQIRDIQFEFTRLKVELQYGLMGFAKDIFTQLGLGSGDFAESLKKINDYIIKNLPEWSNKFATDFVPILRDTWDIFKGLAAIVGDLAVDFTNLVAIFTGDDSLKTKTFDFHKFAEALEKVTHFLAKVVELLEWVERKVGAIELLAGGSAGSSIGAVIGGVLGIEGGPAGVAAGAAAGATTGGWIGTGVGAVAHLMGRYGAATAGTDGSSSSISAISASATDRAEEARQIAKRVSAQTGIRADLIFAQMEHETGGFKNRGARELNNFAGINNPGGNGSDYRKFDSADDFANYYAKLLSSKRYSGLNQATNAQEYASVLKRGGYMADSIDNYSRGMQSALPDYGKGGSGDTTINVGGVTVNNPSGTTDVTKGVLDAMHRQQQVQTQRNIAQFTPAYQ